MSKVSIVQIESSTQKKENLTRALELVKDSKSGGADLVVFPELLMAFSPANQTATELAEIAEPLGGPFTTSLRESAKTTHTAIVATIYETCSTPERVLRLAGPNVLKQLASHCRQIEGFTYLLTLGVCVLTLTEFVLRRSLETEQARLPGFHPENKQKMTDKPTAERILKAFSDSPLTIIKNAAGEDILRRLTLFVRVTGGYLATVGIGCCSLRAA